MEVHEDIGRSTNQNWRFGGQQLLQFCFFRILRSCRWQHDSIHWLLWICLIKHHSSRVYSKWMDLKALHDIFSLQHYIEVAKINWTQQFWVGKQFITRKECKFTSLDLIVIMPILFLVVSYGCRNVAIFNKLLQFHCSMWELLYSVSHNFIQCFAFVFNKLNLFSVFCICIQKTKITFNGLHKHSLHQTYIQWTRQICIGIKNWLLFAFIVSLCVYFYSIRACTFNKVKKTFSCPFIMTESAYQVVRMTFNLQFLFLRYTKVYETLL